MIVFKNVSAFRGNKRALHNISCTLEAGQHYAILGPNGAGKSTLIKLLTRELYPVDTNESSLTFNGQTHITISEWRQHIGIVSEDIQNNYHALATGLEVVCSGLLGAIGIPMHITLSPEQKQAGLELMHTMGIDMLAEKHYLHLSTGQKRRLILARAIIHNPDFLLLDEPTNGLDIPARFWFFKQLDILAQSGTTIILVSHDATEILPQIKSILMLKDGYIFAAGGKEEMLNDKTLSQLFDTKLHVYRKNGFYSVIPA